MGIHFDELVEAASKEVSDKRLRYLDNPRQYLLDLIDKAALFEFPFKPEEIFKRSEKDKQDYDRYLEDYLRLSAEYGQFIIPPFEVTAIEDDESVVIFDPLDFARYNVTIAYKKKDPLMGDLSNIVIGDVIIDNPDRTGAIGVKTAPSYSCTLMDKVMVGEDLLVTDRGAISATVADFTTAVVSYIEELVYIMDPENFIIRKESNQSRKLAEKKKGKGRKPNKTVMRPHYVCLNEDDTREFLQGEAKEPRPAHPVRGHWRTLISERYVNMRGQRILIKQYFTGSGQVEGKHGWHYQVMVKEDPVTIVPYSR